MHVIVNSSILNNYVDAQFAVLLDANIPIERDDVWPNALDGRAKTVHSFTISLLYDNVANTRERLNTEPKKMFVANVDFVKRVDNTVLPSVVGLHGGHNHLEDFGLRSGVYVNTVEGVFQFLSSISDGELGVVQVGGGNVLLESGDPRVVKSGTQVVKGVSSDQRQFQTSIHKVWGRVDEMLVSGLTIHLDSHSVILYQRPNDLCRITDVFIGPINLESSISEVAHNTTEITLIWSFMCIIARMVVDS